MATTTLTVFGNRRFSEAYCSASVTSVALDAVISENFILPAGMGDLWLQTLRAVVFAFSGAYVAPAPAYDGLSLGVVSADGSTGQDILYSARFINVGTSSTRPELAVWAEFYRPVLVRQAERIQISGPILAGAGVTGSVSCQLRGVRLKSA